MSRHHHHRWSIAVVPALGSIMLGCSSPRQEPPAATPATAAQPATSAQPSTTAAVPGPPAYEGFHDVTNCQAISGWVWDRKRPDVPLSVQISDGGTLLARVVAGTSRPDLVTQGKGNGQHSFRYPVPASLKDGKPHTVRISESQDNFQLQGTPKELTCSP
jgi:hypothetical protein